MPQESSGKRTSKTFGNPVELSARFFSLILLCLLFYLPGMTTLPPVDRDEARFAQASKQMLEERDFVRIRFQDGPRHKKPVGIHWLQALAATITGHAEDAVVWPYRLPSLLGAILAVLITFTWGKVSFGERTAFLGAALLASSLLLVTEAHLATADACLLASVTASQGALGRIYLERASSKRKPHAEWAMVLTFWGAQGAGILLKGPVAPFLAFTTLCTLAAADREIRWMKKLRPLAGIPLVLAMVGPWLIAVGTATEGAFFTDSWQQDIWPKIVSGQESHGFPPGYHLLLLSFTFWPGSFLALLALLRAWSQRRLPLFRFALAWIVPFWLAFELIPTKLPHYVLPVFPALALLVADAVLASVVSPKSLAGSWAVRIGLTGWALATAVLATIIPAATWYFSGSLHPLSFVPTITGAALILYGSIRMKRGLWLKVCRVSVAGALLMLAPTLHFVLPGIDELWLSRQAAEAVEKHKTVESIREIPLASAGYHEPSLVFLCGTRTKLLGPEEGAELLFSAPRALCFVDGRSRETFLKKLDDLGIQGQVSIALKGFNYSKGRWVFLGLYERLQPSGDSGIP